MIPVIPVYYAVIALLSLVLMKNMDIITLPEIPSVFGSGASKQPPAPSVFVEYYEKSKLYLIQLKEYYQAFLKFAVPLYHQVVHAVAEKLALYAEVASRFAYLLSRPLVPWVRPYAPYYHHALDVCAPYYSYVVGTSTDFYRSTIKFSAPYYAHAKTHSAIAWFHFKKTIEHLLALLQSKSKLFYQYAVVHVTHLSKAWSPLLDDLVDYYEVKVAPFVEEHKTPLSVGLVVIVVAILSRVLSRVFGVVFKGIAKDAHNLNKGVTGMYRSGSGDSDSEFGGPQFDKLLSESGVINDGIAEQEASSLRSTKSTSGSNNSTQRRLGDVFTRRSLNGNQRGLSLTETSSSSGSPSPVKTSGRNRTPLSSKQTYPSQSASPTSVSQPSTPVKGSQSPFEGDRAQEQGITSFEAIAHEKSLNQIRIGSEVYEVTSDILSATTQDPKSLRNNHFKLFGFLPRTPDPRPETPGRSSLSDDLDSLTELSNIDSVPLSVRAESISRILDSPLRLARSAVSTGSFINGSPHKVGLLPPSLAFVSSSPSAAPTTSRTHVYTNDQIENSSSSVQYLSDISNGRISRHSSPLSSGSNLIYM